VDQATDVALHLRQFVASNPQLKKALGFSDDQSLPISTLRGQFVDNREWLDNPSVPAIIVGTVDMIGSRLLFEGYGVSRKMRPYHAGLLGVDTLFVLDEAHLVPPFEHLLRAIVTDSAFRPRDQCAMRDIPPIKLLSLSATRLARNTNNSVVFKLTRDDFKHPVASKRLNAKKWIRFDRLQAGQKLEETAATHAWTLTGNGSKPVRVLIYSDSREVVQNIKGIIEQLAKGKKNAGSCSVSIETELFVGARRVFERDQARERLKSLGFIAGGNVEITHPVFLFATSAGEVGVDLDADHMICDLVTWERMVQRLGRVNRRGDGEANIVVIVEQEPKPDKKQQAALAKRARGAKLDETETKRIQTFEKLMDEWKSRQTLIQRLPENSHGSYDASPMALNQLNNRSLTDPTLREILCKATTPEPLRPEITRALVDAWAMTSLEKHTGRPEIQPWLRGWIEEEPMTAVVWRKYLPVRTTGPEPSASEIKSFFEAAPPHMSELLETETIRVVEWLAACAKRLRKQLSDEQSSTNLPVLRDEDVMAFVLDPDGNLRTRYELRKLANFNDKNFKEEIRGILKGATLVVDARFGGLKDGLLDAGESTEPRTADDGHPWLGEGVVGFRVRNVDASVNIPCDKNWQERYRFPCEMSEDGEVTRWLLIEKWREVAATEDDRSTGKPQLLDEHQARAGKHARLLAQAIGLREELKNALVLAACLHDEGKRASRWQRSFHAPNNGVYAKTQGPIDYRLLDGYRHELGSLLRVEDNDDIRRLPDNLRDLVLHLITVHHGFGRPLIGISGCEDKPPSLLKNKATEIAIRFARLHECWGPWGLAWLESLVRAADQQASREDNAGVAAGGEF
jgi:CRISPR-associated endonuclease/helicase Cas3